MGTPFPTSLMQLFQLFNQVFLGFLFLDPSPAKTLPLAQEEWGTNEEGEKKILHQVLVIYTGQQSVFHTRFKTPLFSSHIFNHFPGEVNSSSKIRKAKGTMSIQQQLKICHH